MHAFCVFLKGKKGACWGYYWSFGSDVACE